MTKNRYLVYYGPASADSIHDALKRSLHVAAEDCNAAGRILLLLESAWAREDPYLVQALDRLLSRQTRRLLQRRQEVSLSGKLSVAMGLARAVTSTLNAIITINPHPDSLRNVVERHHFGGPRLVIPYHLDSVRDWFRTWQPTVIPGGEWPGPKLPPIDPIAVRAATSLNPDGHRRYLKNFLVDNAQNLLWELRQAGVLPAPADIRLAADRTGFEPKSADRLAAMTDRMASRKTPPRATYFPDASTLREVIDDL